MYEQLTLFQPSAPPPHARYGSGVGQAPAVPGRKDSAHMESIFLDRLLPLEDYDKIIVLFSGGKDSLACLLDLLERGVPREKIECWHHDIDGGHPTRKMDWPVTQNYVRAVTEHLGVTLRVSWRVNGFWGEVYRIGASWPSSEIPLTAPFPAPPKTAPDGKFLRFRTGFASLDSGPRRTQKRRFGEGRQLSHSLVQFYPQNHGGGFRHAQFEYGGIENHGHQPTIPLQRLHCQWAFLLPEPQAGGRR